MDKAQYRVKQGQNFGARKQFEAGAIVELTEEEAAGFLDKLELVGGNLTPQPASALTEGGFFVTPQTQTTRPDLRTAILAASDEELIAIPGIGPNSVAQLRAWAAGDELPTGSNKSTATAEVEKQLEAETGKDFTQTGNQPPTLAETDKAATNSTTGDDAPATPPATQEQGSTPSQNPPVIPPATQEQGSGNSMPILTTGNSEPQNRRTQNRR